MRVEGSVAKRMCVEVLVRNHRFRFLKLANLHNQYSLHRIVQYYNWHDTKIGDFPKNYTLPWKSMGFPMVTN